MGLTHVTNSPSCYSSAFHFCETALSCEPVSLYSSQNGELLDGGSPSHYLDTVLPTLTLLYSDLYKVRK